MKYVNAFLKFWYDFFIGDAWELAAGVVITLLIMAALVALTAGSATLSGLIWLILPIGIGLTLSLSVLLYGRHSAK